MTSYVGWELSHLGDEDLVFETSDDEHTFDIRWLSPTEARRAITEFSETSWDDLEGKSPWTQHDRREVAKTPDEIALIRKMFGRKMSWNAVGRCPSLRRALTASRIAYGERAVASVSAIAHPEMQAHAKTIGAVYMPVFSEEGQSALLLVSRSWAPLAGVGLILKIERTENGTWVPTRAQQVWVS